VIESFYSKNVCSHLEEEEETHHHHQYIDLKKKTPVLNGKN
jgi:hypothetical protein